MIRLLDDYIDFNSWFSITVDVAVLLCFAQAYALSHDVVYIGIMALIVDREIQAIKYKRELKKLEC